MANVQLLKKITPFWIICLTLPMLTGCDFQVIYPWEPGGKQRQRKVAKVPPPPERKMPPSRPVIASPSQGEGCQQPKNPPTEIVLDNNKWASGMNVVFQEPSTNRDGSPVQELKSVLVYYHIDQQGSLGAPLLATTIHAKSKEGGKKNGGLISFAQLKDLQRFLRARQEVRTVFCSQAVNSAGPGKMSSSIGITFRRDKGWIPPPS